MKTLKGTEQMLGGSTRFFWRKCRQYLRRLVPMSSAKRRWIICRAVSQVVTRRQRGVRLGILRILQISYLKPSVPDPLFIICEARTGSTLLGDYLNSHPMVTCEFEILNRGKITHFALRSRAVGTGCTLLPGHPF